MILGAFVACGRVLEFFRLDSFCATTCLQLNLSQNTLLQPSWQTKEFIFNNITLYNMINFKNLDCQGTDHDFFFWCLISFHDLCSLIVFRTFRKINLILGNIFKLISWRNFFSNKGIFAGRVKLSAKGLSSKKNGRWGRPLKIRKEWRRQKTWEKKKLSSDEVDVVFEYIWNIWRMFVYSDHGQNQIFFAFEGGAPHYHLIQHPLPPMNGQNSQFPKWTKPLLENVEKLLITLK